MFYLYISDSHNPYKNLATEEVLTDIANFHLNTYFLYFWKNKNSVILGRNQDAFSEVNIDFLRTNKIKLARRKTGGGAVFHDKNNLNFSFIIPKNKFDKTISLNIIKNALLSLGINAEISGRNDILVNNKKISGNAYLNKENVTLHHGTILLNTNFELLENVLNVNTQKLKSHGVKSVKSRVLNLKDLYPKLTVKDLENAIQKEFEQTYSGKCIYFDKMPDIDVDFYSSDEWIFGDKKFINQEKFSHKFDWGTCEIKILKSKHKKYIKIYSDSLDCEIIELAENLLNISNKPPRNSNPKIVEIFEFYNNILSLQ